MDRSTTSHDAQGVAKDVQPPISIVAPRIVESPVSHALVLFAVSTIHLVK
uniref:Uncharacterized protein n=1 Tax=Romanomermis culicivorax TaxID=13658 RepID=A0A915IDM1_ROMCU